MKDQNLKNELKMKASNVKGTVGKHFDNFKELNADFSSTLKKKPRLGLWVVRYWWTFGVIGLPLVAVFTSVMIHYKGLDAIFNLLSEVKLEVFSLFIVMLFTAYVIVYTIWRIRLTWIAKNEKLFETMWLKELGNLLKKHRQSKTETSEQWFERISTELVNNIIETKEFKLLRDPKFTDQNYHPSYFRRRLFNAEAIRSQAKNWFFNTYAILDFTKTYEEDEPVWQNVNQEKNKTVEQEVKPNEEINIEQQITTDSSENLQPTNSTVSDSISDLSVGND